MTQEKGQSNFNCPACHEVLRYTTRLKVNAFVEATFEPDERQAEIEHEKFMRSVEFRCPKCEVVVQIHYQLTVVDIVRLDKTSEAAPNGATTNPNQQTSSRLRPKEVELCKTCHTNGLMDVFAQVVRDQTNVAMRPPKDLDRFFISFLRTAVKTFLPRAAVAEFAREFPGQIEFWKAQRIGMVLSDGRVCRFIPMRAMNLRDVKSRGERMEVEGTGVHRGAETFDYVRRTKLGYVPPNARIFLESLRHSLGDRGHEMQSVPLRPKQ